MRAGTNAVAAGGGDMKVFSFLFGGFVANFGTDFEAKKWRGSLSVSLMYSGYQIWQLIAKRCPSEVETPLGFQFAVGLSGSREAVVDELS